MCADQVGPYDEVIWIPGSYETPPLEGTRMVRISRIYVSTVESVYNGGYSPDTCNLVVTDTVLCRTKELEHSKRGTIHLN